MDVSSIARTRLALREHPENATPAERQLASTRTEMNRDLTRLRENFQNLHGKAQVQAIDAYQRKLATWQGLLQRQEADLQKEGRARPAHENPDHNNPASMPAAQRTNLQSQDPHLTQLHANLTDAREDFLNTLTQLQAKKEITPADREQLAKAEQRHQRLQEELTTEQETARQLQELQHAFQQTTNPQKP